MELKSSIFLTFFLPITLSSIIILGTIYYLILHFTDNITQNMEEHMIEDAKDNINQVINAIQYQIQSEYQQIVIHISAVNCLMNLINKQQNIINNNYDTLPLAQFNFQQYNDTIKKYPKFTIDRLKNYTSSFYNSQTNSFDELNNDDKQFLNLNKHTAALIYPIFKFPGTSLISLVSTYIISIDSGTTYDFPDNINEYNQSLNEKTQQRQPQDPDCQYQDKKYPYEYRCRSWFKETNILRNNSITFVKPYIDSISNKIISTICVKSFDMKNILCFDFTFKINPFSQTDYNNQTSYYYLIFPGTREPIIYPYLDDKKIKNIDSYEFENSTKKEEMEYFQEQTKFYEQTHSDINCLLHLREHEKQTVSIKFTKDLQNYYLFVKNITTCQKIISEDFKNNPKKAFMSLDSQADIRAYLVYSLKEETILQGVHNIQNQISLILVIDQMFIILIILVMVYQVFTFTFALSSLITQPVDHLIACLRKIQAEELEKVVEQLSENLVKGQTSDQKQDKKRKNTKKNKQRKSKSQSLENKGTSSDNIHLLSSDDSSTSDNDSSEESITTEERNRKNILKKKIKEESNKILKQVKKEQQDQISPDLLDLYRVLYEIVHVIKEANKTFLDGNQEQALITYSKSINFFKALKNEVFKTYYELIENNAVSICLNNMGNVYMQQKQYIQASEKYKESLQFVKEQREKFRELYKKHVSERVLHTDEQYRYYSSLFISRSFHLAEALLEAIQQKQYDAMKFLGLFTENECYAAIKSKYEVIKQQVKIFNPARNVFDPMIAHVLLQLAFCSIELGKKSESIMYLEEAEDEIRKQINPNYPFHLDIPKEILLQRALYLKGYLNIRINQYYIGSIFLTKSIEHGKIYCPKYRLKALLLLKNLFDMIEEKQQYSAFSGVNYLLEKYKPLIKDALFLSNISSSMGTREKILVSSQTIQTIFEKYIGRKFDRVGYYLFNESVKEVFPLQRVDKTWHFLDNMFQNMPTVYGRGCIQQALNEAYRIFDNNQYYAHSLNMKKVDLTYKKFVILFTDEADILQEGKQIKKQWQNIKENFRYSNIILVIYAFTDNNEVMRIFKELVDYCQDGFVIHYKEYKTIHSYFQNLTETFIQDSYEIEYIS